jgi:hypothetical protein
MPHQCGWGADQIATNRMKDCLHARVGAELLIDAVEVITQSLRRDRQRAGNLAGASAFRESGQYSTLLLGEASQ